jgi:phosphatidylserine decarboxylase precursor-related protein
MIYLFFIILFIISFYLFFYRKPYLLSYSIDDNLIYSPAFGKIISIKESFNYIHVIIFLSITDIHFQYIPINGTILNQFYDHSGKFHLAYKLDKSDFNEKLITIIKPNLPNTKNIIVQQIAGLFTRRITSFIPYFPYNVKVGQDLGIIHLGSRVDLILPKENLDLYVKVNDIVKGPNTLIGKINLL